CEGVVELIECRIETYGAVPSVLAFEDLVRAAASIAHAVTRSGRPVQLIGARGTQVSTTEAGWSQALHWLARVQLHGALSPLEVYRSAVAPGTPVVVCSADTDVPAAFAQRGIPVPAVLVDAASYGDRGDSGRWSGEIVVGSIGYPL